jgi:tight adherence protein B
MGVLSMFLLFCAVALLSYSAVPDLYNKTVSISQKREKVIAGKMERMLPRADIRRMSRLLILSPLILAAGFYFIFPSQIRLFGILFGILIGLALPGIYTQALAAKTRRKFDDQLIDALMIMSSSFRGGLSLVQALEAVVEEMPNPINQEFGTVLGENKMGVSLEEALGHLYKRMPSAAMQQMITAILLARETGGNLPVVFSRIVNTIRERKKIQQNIDTLTLQGKIQGVVMAMLPIVFAVVVYSSNRNYMDIMLNTAMGQKMIGYAIFSEIIGAFLIWRYSTLKDF